MKTPHHFIDSREVSNLREKIETTLKLHKKVAEDIFGAAADLDACQRRADFLWEVSIAMWDFKQAQALTREQWEAETKE